MNARQQRFVDEFLKLGNATQAAIAAGYSRKTAKLHRLTAVVQCCNVAAAIAKRQTKAASQGRNGRVRHPRTHAARLG
jgi:phage terminase small subunit